MPSEALQCYCPDQVEGERVPFGTARECLALSAVMIRRWKRWLKIINRDIVGLSHQRRIFREIAVMFQTNPTLQIDGTVWHWLAANYASTAAVGVRRQADRRRDVISLERLLTEIAGNQGVLTRAWFVSQYGRDRPLTQRRDFQRFGERDFNKFAGPTSPRISKSRILSDRRKLRRAAARVRHYVNKRLAHRALRGYRGPATFEDLNAAIDVLGRLLQRYSLLLNQAGMISIEPVIQGNWEAIFRVPWKI